MGKKRTQETTYNVQPLRTAEEIAEFKWALKRFASDRDRFMFTIGINTGLRASDLVKLKVSDVHGKNTSTIVEEKTGKPRRLYLAAIQDEIMEFCDGKADDEWLFPSRKGIGHISPTQAYRSLNKAAEALDRQDVGTHTMRKTFGYHYYQKTKDIATLMEIFGHSAPSITKRYIGITEDEIQQSLADFKL